MLNYSESPPPLHHSPATSNKTRPYSCSRESTPLTPVDVATVSVRKPDKGLRAKDGQLPGLRKPLVAGVATADLLAEAPLLEPNFDDHSFPLFGASPPTHRMLGAEAPSDTRSQESASPPNSQQSSTLTSALQKNLPAETRRFHDTSHERNENIECSKAISMAEGSAYTGSGAKPISMQGISSDKGRRGSIPQSSHGGMSWGGISVGSLIRDDMIMSGTSPFTMGNSPSYQSSSYLPKLEANFMRDFSCCGMTLPTLHDLLQHYEEAHAQKPMPASRPGAVDQPPGPDTRAALATNAAAAVHHQTQEQQQQQQQLQENRPEERGNSRIEGPNQPSIRPTHNLVSSHKGSTFSNLQTIPDMDALDDMEMEDVHEPAQGDTGPTTIPQPASSIHADPTVFDRAAQPRVPQLNVNLTRGHHQGLRTSTPTTPDAAGRQGLPFQNNPTVSSVNTPTLMSNPALQHGHDLNSLYRKSPDSSTPGTPAELDESITNGLGDMTMHHSHMPPGTQNLPYGLGGDLANDDALDLCIDEPAKRLFSPTGGYVSSTQQIAHMKLGAGQYGPDSDIAKRIREQQMLAGVPDTTAGMMPNDEPKPFRCPVIGCEKAYKNHNGLKYHKSHGHNNQCLHDNADGTFSIVNPETSVPYEGTLGMEKEKPFRCDICGKRYKNLNGLKYHKSHSPPCNLTCSTAGNRNGMGDPVSEYQPRLEVPPGVGLTAEPNVA